MSAQRQWCPDCRRRSNIVDTFTESHYTRRGEHAYRVNELSCGHTTETQPVRVGDAPGAPSVNGAHHNIKAAIRAAGETPWEVPA